MSRATKAAVAASLALLLATAAAGCSDTQVAEAAQSKRYEIEVVYSWSPSVEVVTDTETGRRWLIATNSAGGVAIEPMDGGDSHD